jgi:cbb3-type cytochrome oxidase subunit 3
MMQLEVLQVANARQIYPTKERPRFIKGHGITMAMVGFAIVCYAVLWFALDRINKRREKGEEEHLITGMSDEEVAELGDESPRFRYTI